MSRLSSEAEELVRAGRSALRPRELDRQRVFDGLTHRLTGSARTEPSGLDLARPATAGVPVGKIVSLILGLGAAGAGSFLLLRAEHSPTAAIGAPIPVLSVPVSSALPPPASSAPEAAELAPAPRAPPSSLPVAEGRAAPVQRARSVRRTPSPDRSADTLADEVALLSRATAELHAERAAAALDLLAEHERRFPNAVLGQERSAARVRALCALGRVEEARAESARLLQRAPGSPHAARAAQGCPSSVGSDLGVRE